MIIFFYLAMERHTAGIVAAIFSTHSFILTVEGGLFFHEDHLLHKSIACAIMLVGAVMVII